MLFYFLHIIKGREICATRKHRRRNQIVCINGKKTILLLICNRVSDLVEFNRIRLERRILGRRQIKGFVQYPFFGTKVIIMVRKGMLIKKIRRIVFDIKKGRPQIKQLFATRWGINGRETKGIGLIKKNSIIFVI